MDLSQDTTALIALISAGVALISLAFSLLLARRLRRVRRMVAARRSSAGEGSPIPDEYLALELQRVSEDVEMLQQSLVGAVQHVGLVRFDAFEDMGGKLSFAAALLDGRGNGMVLSSINGRSETRIYAKPIEHGSSRYNLSDEEEEALKRARGAVRR